MNKNYERCSYCSRRMWFTAGYFRLDRLQTKECNHLQRSIENKLDFNCTDNFNCVLLPDRKSVSNKILKFWKTKIGITGTIRSIRAYFNKDFDEHLCKLVNSHSCSNSDLRTVSKRAEASNEDIDNKKSSRGHYVEENSHIKGHCQHASVELCTVYCQLSRHGWYWGNISSSEAEDLLAGQHDNVFLVRDSCDSQHILCVSFRCIGRTLHARLRHANGLFSLNNETFVPPSRLSEHCADVDVRVQIQSYRLDMPVKLARPLNRFAKLDSLQMICRFVIRKSVKSNLWDKLPLPSFLLSYIATGSDYIITL